MSGGVILQGKSAKVAAREIVVAPRLPDRPTEYRTPFEAEGDVVADCSLCGYHAMGPRRMVGRAMREHHRLLHPEQTGVILLNAPRQ